MSKVAFNTANLVGRPTGYRFELNSWGEQDLLVRQQTDEREFVAICREIADAGFTAVELWVAHVDPAKLTDARAKLYRQILADSGLKPIGLAAGLDKETARVCQQLHIPVCNGGMWDTDLETVCRVSQASGIKFNYENHPEKSAQEIVARIDGRGPGVGVAVDTGWLATQGTDVPAAIRQLGKLVRHVHLKDVKTAGGHETVPLGSGVADIPGVIAALKEIGYAGWYSWEDEPENRNPFDIASQMREWIETRVK